MAENSKIEWTDHTINFWWGCTKVSEACRYCYAALLDAMRGPLFDEGRVHWGPNAPRWVKIDSATKDVRRFAKKGAKLGIRYRVFVNSMSDTFEDHPQLPAAREILFAEIEKHPGMDFLLLTKRPENVRGMVPPHWLENWPAHVWMGTTVENQEMADKRIPELLNIPARIRFLSCEPLLEKLDIGLRFDKVPAAKWWPSGESTPEGPYPWPSRWVQLRYEVRSDFPTSPVMRAAPGIYRAHSNRHGALSVQTDNGLLGIKPDEFEVLPGVDWVIAGGESGPNARPMHPDWAHSLRDQCQVAHVPFFFKQWGEWDGSPYPMPGVKHVELDGTLLNAPTPTSYPMRPVGKKTAGRELDCREHNAFPQITL